MGIAFLLDPSTDMDDFIGTDDETVDDQICEMTTKCGLLTPTTCGPILIAEIIGFKSKKRRGGKAMRGESTQYQVPGTTGMARGPSVSIAAEDITDRFCDSYFFGR
ncbi:unnamed protein product [Phytophthora fragariaefolia]|uniref:Unnamed protein product n=1 Tax=Phytophthora fragariaefolia TaxID=1490495 RepID=A0A9W7D0Z8_9STRA|nr:unnamed protein product [Phytophthora fragariaefolia]